MSISRTLVHMCKVWAPDYQFRMARYSSLVLGYAQALTEEKIKWQSESALLVFVMKEMWGSETAGLSLHSATRDELRY